MKEFFLASKASMSASFRKILQVIVGLTLISGEIAFGQANPLAIPSVDARPTVSSARTIFMNGIDISSARNQDLRNVHIKIDEFGNIFVTAPHYQVTEEETFTPLSSYKHATSAPEHRAPGPLANRGSSEPESVPPVKPQAGDSAIVNPVQPGQRPSSAFSNPPPAPSPDQPASAKMPR